jgi:hypothetical protein
MLAASQSAQPTKSNASLWTAQSVLWPNGRCFVLFRSASTCNWEGLTELTQTRSRRLSTKAWLVGMEARMQVQHDACHVGTVHHVAIRCNMLQHSEAAAAEAKCQKNCKYRLRVVQACAEHMNRAIASHNFAAGISDRALKELYTLSMMQPAWIDAKYRIAQ